MADRIFQHIKWTAGKAPVLKELTFQEETQKKIVYSVIRASEDWSQQTWKPEWAIRGCGRQALSDRCSEKENLFEEGQFYHTEILSFEGRAFQKLWVSRNSKERGRDVNAAPQHPSSGASTTASLSLCFSNYKTRPTLTLHRHDVKIKWWYKQSLVRSRQNKWDVHITNLFQTLLEGKSRIAPETGMNLGMNLICEDW